MKKHELFIEVLNDLREKIGSNKPYHIIKATELIRTLLFDKSGPLVDKLNKKYKIKFQFKHCDTRRDLESLEKIGIPIPDTYICADGFYPETMPSQEKTIISNRDSFYKTLIMIHEGKEYTVKDVLDHVLYILGGTHHDDPKKEEELILTNLNKHFTIGNISAVVYQIKAISRVVIKSLTELENKIIFEYY